MSDPVRSVVRALDLVGILARPDAAEGLRLIDVVQRTSLQKTTVSRLLQTMVSTGHILQKEGDRYVLGAQFIAFGRAAEKWHSLAGVARPVLEDIAEQLGDSVYVSLRAGDKAVCIGLVHGAYPVRTLTLNVGDVRPLGVGAGSLAILAFLSDGSRESLLPRLAEDVKGWEGFNRDRLEELVMAAKGQGFSFNEHMIIRGVSGVGVPIFADRVEPVGAVSLAAIDDRLSEERRVAVARLLQDGAETIGESWAAVLGSTASLSLESALEHAARWW